MSGKYNCFSGHYFKKVKIEDCQTLSATFSAETEKGNLIAKVIDTEGPTRKELQEGDTVTINTLGEYKLQVEENKHKGNFTLSWEIE